MKAWSAIDIILKKILSNLPLKKGLLSQLLKNLGTLGKKLSENYKMDKQLNQIEQEELRDRNLISETEVALVSGDLLIAENVVTKSRRIIGKASVLTENKRLLKG